MFGVGRQLVRSYATRPLPPVLNQVLDVGKAGELDKESLQSLWRVHHGEIEGALCAVVDAEKGEVLRARVEESPRMVVPIPKEKGFVTVLSEGRVDDSVPGVACVDMAYTFLHTFQEYGHAASPVVVTRYYYDMADSHNAVLMAGSRDQAAVSLEEGQYLGNQTSILYLNDDMYSKFTHVFNHQPNSFDFDAILDSLEITPA